MFTGRTCLPFLAGAHANDEVDLILAVTVGFTAYSEVVLVDTSDVVLRDGGCGQPLCVSPPECHVDKALTHVGAVDVGHEDHELTGVSRLAPKTEINAILSGFNEAKHWFLVCT